MSEGAVTPSAFQLARGLDPRRYRDRSHGTRLRYLAGCRCMLCRAANSRYECERAATRRRGRGNGIVSASRARVHFLRLSREGVGRDAVHHASDVSRTVLQGIAAGRKSTIRAETERRILAVDTSARADGSLVPAGRTWERIDELLEEGYTKAFIARALGAKIPALQVHRTRILARGQDRASPPEPDRSRAFPCRRSEVLVMEARGERRRGNSRRNRRHLVVPEVDLGDGNRVAARVEIDVEAGTIMIKKLRGRRFWKMPLSEAIGMAGRRAQVLALNARGAQEGRGAR